MFLHSDAVFSPAQCGRVPGTISQKNGNPVELLWMEEDARYDVAEIVAALDRVGAPTVESTPSPRKSRNRTATTQHDEIDVDPDRIQALWNLLPPWGQDLISKGKQPGDRYRSRSEADAAVVRLLVDLEATETEIRWFFLNNEDGIGARFAERGFDYLERTIDFVQSKAWAEDGDWVTVTGVRSYGPGSRVVLTLEVLTGPHAGLSFSHGVGSTSSAWPWMFCAAGLRPAPKGNASAAGALMGRDLRVRLRRTTIAGEQHLDVTRFLQSPSIGGQSQT